MKRELVYMDAKSSKFWNIEVSGSNYTVRYGRTGTEGQSLEKKFPSPEAATKDAEKLIREKLGKGYTDAAGAGVSTTGIPTGGDGSIPLIAFSSINRRDDISNNAGTFVGHRVVDYDQEKEPKKGAVYRFRSDWDGKEILPDLEHFFESDAAADATAIVIGAWHGEDSSASSEEVIKALVANKDKLPNLAALYLGDITSEENEMSWIQQSDISPLLASFPKLQLLRARGGTDLALKKPKHATLRGLALETGGLNVEVLRAIGNSDFPNLEYLELWLGTDEYGSNSTVADLQPILSGNLFPKLKYLGLRNAQNVDDIAGVVVNSPLIGRIETLDLSLGVLTDEGGKALLKLPASPTLKKLNLHYNFLSPELVKQLKTLPLMVDTSKPSDMEDDDEFRFVAVGE